MPTLKTLLLATMATSTTLAVPILLPGSAEVPGAVTPLDSNQLDLIPATLPVHEMDKRDDQEPDVDINFEDELEDELEEEMPARSTLQRKKAPGTQTRGGTTAGRQTRGGGQTRPGGQTQTFSVKPQPVSPDILAQISRPPPIAVSSPRKISPAILG